MLAAEHRSARTERLLGVEPHERIIRSAPLRRIIRRVLFAVATVLALLVAVTR